MQLLYKLAFSLVFLPALLGAQVTDRDAVVLRSGRTYVGTLIEETHPDSVHLRTPNGEVLPFHRHAIAAITKESALIPRSAEPSDHLGLLH